MKKILKQMRERRETTQKYLKDRLFQGNDKDYALYGSELRRYLQTKYSGEVYISLENIVTFARRAKRKGKQDKARVFYLMATKEFEREEDSNVHRRYFKVLEMLEELGDESLIRNHKGERLKYEEYTFSFDKAGELATELGLNLENRLKIYGEIEKRRILLKEEKEEIQQQIEKLEKGIIEKDKEIRNMASSLLKKLDLPKD